MPEKTIECPSCALPIDATVEECPYCGYELPQRKKSRQLAVLLVAVVLIIWLLMTW